MNRKITIPEREAEAMLSLYERCLDAEKMFERCQSVSFRGFLIHAAGSPNVKAAFAHLSAMLRNPEPETRRNRTRKEEKDASDGRGEPQPEENAACGER